MRRTHRLGVALLAVAMFTSGCYGPFYLTRKVWDWNGKVGGKWTNEVVFLVLAWLPVYSLATLADGIIFNSIEFWTGNNPVQNVRNDAPAHRTKRIVRGDAEAQLTQLSGPEGEQLTIQQYQHGQPAGSLFIQHKDGATIGTDANGNVLFTAKTMADGSVVISDAHGKVVNSYSADKVQRFAQSVTK